MTEITVSPAVINIVPDDDIDVSISIAPLAAPSKGETNATKLAQKHMFKVAFSLVTVSAVGIFGDLPVHRSQYTYHHEFLSKAYAIAILATFAFGMGLLLLSVALPRLPMAVRFANKLLWTALSLVHVALVLKMTIQVIS